MAPREATPMAIHNGQPVPVDGWYADTHGHQLFMPQGTLVPICPHHGPGLVVWRLIRQVGDRR